jgi:hypothetical protein
MSNRYLHQFSSIKILIYRYFTRMQFHTNISRNGAKKLNCYDYKLNYCNNWIIDDNRNGKKLIRVMTYDYL